MIAMQDVNNIIISLCIFDVDLNENTQLKDDLGFDSLKIVELIISLENTLNISFNMADLDPGKLNTVSDVYSIVSKAFESLNLQQKTI